MRSVPRCYKQNKLGAGVSEEVVSEWVRELLRFSPCELLLLEAGSWGRGQFGNPKVAERPSLYAATKQRLVQTVTGREHLSLYVVTSCAFNKSRLPTQTASIVTLTRDNRVHCTSHIHINLPSTLTAQTRNKLKQKTAQLVSTYQVPYIHATW
jgi:hypothetical protein